MKSKTYRSKNKKFQAVDNNLATNEFDEWIVKEVGPDVATLFEKGTLARRIIIKYAQYVAFKSEQPIGGFISRKLAFKIAENMNPVPESYRLRPRKKLKNFP